MPAPSAAVSWVQVGGGTGSDQGNGIAVNTAGTGIFVTGQMSTTNTNLTGVKFQQHHSEPGNIGSGTTANNEIFLVKYDASGTYQWAVGAGGTAGDIAYGVAVNGANVYVTGYTNNNTVGCECGAGARQQRARPAPMPGAGSFDGQRHHRCVRGQVRGQRQQHRYCHLGTGGRQHQRRPGQRHCRERLGRVRGGADVCWGQRRCHRHSFGGAPLAGISPPSTSANQDAFLARYNDGASSCSRGLGAGRGRHRER